MLNDYWIQLGYTLIELKNDSGSVKVQLGCSVKNDQDLVK